MPIYLKELIRHIEFVSSKQFIDFFESQVSKEVEVIRSSVNPKSRKTRWAIEARRSLRYAFFLRYYASFEGHLRGICEYRAEHEALPLRLSDIYSRKGLLQQVNKYLTRVAKCRRPLDANPLWGDVVAYAWVRNNIVHNDGQVGPEKPEQFVKLLLARPSAGLSLRNGRIVLKKAFCYRSISVMARFLMHVIESRSDEVDDAFWKEFDQHIGQPKKSSNAAHKVVAT